jgi:predicted patatin/cPLA2 family phospholipase
MEASRLFYNELDHSLTEKMNFVRNKYDTCVYNRRNENGEVTTIKTHVNDLKVPSKSKTNLDRVVKELKDIYKEIMVHEGNTHNYLGMIMTYDKEKKCVRINMEKYIEEIINVFKENEPDKKIKNSYDTCNQQFV